MVLPRKGEYALLPTIRLAKCSVCARGVCRRIVPDSETPATDLSATNRLRSVTIFVELWITSGTPPVAALRKDLPCFWRACGPIAHVRPVECRTAGHTRNVQPVHLR
jgi:hypothetical protein